MYLVEMFPAVDVDSIIAIIANRPHSSIESLVEDCLALDTDVFMLPSAPPLPASSHSALSDPGESAAQEAVSLVPVSWAPQSAAATFSRASTSSSHSSCANHVSEIDAEPGAKSPRSVALPANDDSVSKAAAAIIQNTNAGGAKATIGTPSAVRWPSVASKIDNAMDIC